MKKHYIAQFIIGCVSVCLSFLFVACGSTPVANNLTPTSTTPAGATLTPTTANKTPVVTQTITTAPVPPTLTSCPANGTARAAVMAPLALGSHANIVYIVNQYKKQVPTFGTLTRYNVTTGNKTVIVTLPGTIDSAQLSADGQWILFVSRSANIPTPQKLQMIRLDGQGLQTLYCGYLPNPQWSTDQKHIAFATSANGQDSLDVLDVTSGTLTKYLTTSNFSNGVVLRTWLDNTRLYLTSVPIDQPPNNIYILDTSKGPNQQMSDLITVVSNKTFGDFDSSYDGSHLFVDYGYCTQGGCVPPGKITVQSATGGPETTIFDSPQNDTTTVRAVTAHTLLMVIHNASFTNQHVDQSDNGLWAINTDGSDPRRMSTDNANQWSELNYFSQFPWSNVSRDSSMFAFQQNRTQGNNSVSLLYGSLNGGPAPTAFASLADGTALNLVGWTTM